MIKDEKGQSLVEFALLLPVLLLLIVGIFDFGRVLYSYSHLHMATQETVRLGALGKSDEEIRSFAHNYIHIGDPDDLVISISPTEGERESGDYVTVELEYPIELITPFLSSILPSPVVIETDSTIRVE
jgi:Flp pilus assembly protein TadG